MAGKKKTKYMAKGGKTSKYMAKGGPVTAAQKKNLPPKLVKILEQKSGKKKA